MKKQLHWISLVLIILVGNCTTKNDPAPVKVQEGLWVLHEGTFNLNNAGLSAINLDSGKVVVDFFRRQNGRALGDVANDMKRYGGKVYIVVNNSSILEIVDVANGQSQATISMINDGFEPRQPRQVAFDDGKAYVCSYDGSIAVIDTTSLKIVTYLNSSGQNPDGIAVQNGNLYVSNSGGLNYPDYDNTVSVFDLNTNKEIKKITVGLNPGTLAADPHGDVYVLCRGDYDQVPSSIKIIDASSDEVKGSLLITGSSISLFGTTLYVSNYDFITRKSTIAVVDVLTEDVISHNLIDLSDVQTLYGLYVDENDGQIFVTDAKDFTSQGKVFEYNLEGELQRSFVVGVNPSKLLKITTTR